MKRVTFYLLAWLAASISLLFLHHIVKVPEWYMNNIILAQCTYFGTIGGVLYCLRAIYVNKCVKDSWDDKWLIWHMLRPITSSISGLICCVFLKAGLLVLDAAYNSESTSFGYYALSFIAGYNVDNFLKKLEAIAESVWGINKSRSSGE